MKSKNRLASSLLLALAAGLVSSVLVAGCAAPFEDVAAQIKSGDMTASRLRGLAGDYSSRWQLDCLLYAAVVVEEPKVAAELIKRGALTDYVNPDSGCVDKTRVASFLHRAVLTENVEMVSLLIASGAKLEETRYSRSSLTPLLLAASKRNVRLVRLLLKAGANPRAMDEDGATALNLASRPEVSEAELVLHPTEIEQIFIDAGVERTDAETLRTRALRNAQTRASWERAGREAEAERVREERREAQRREREAEEEAQEARDREIERIQASKRGYQERLHGGKDPAAEEPAPATEAPAAPAGGLTLTQTRVEHKKVRESPPWKPPPRPGPRQLDPPRPNTCPQGGCVMPK
jgi:hypothetical protein